MHPIINFSGKAFSYSVYTFDEASYEPIAPWAAAIAAQADKGLSNADLGCPRVRWMLLPWSLHMREAGVDVGDAIACVEPQSFELSESCDGSGRGPGGTAGPRITRPDRPCLVCDIVTDRFPTQTPVFVQSCCLI